jgi:hypothetical protein
MEVRQYLFPQLSRFSPSTLQSLPKLSQLSLTSGEIGDIIKIGRVYSMLESTIVEFKREYNEKVNNTMLAFLNTEGGIRYP